jgi:hypothetical protein
MNVAHLFTRREVIGVLQVGQRVDVVVAGDRQEGGVQKVFALLSHIFTKFHFLNQAEKYIKAAFCK